MISTMSASLGSSRRGEDLRDVIKGKLERKDFSSLNGRLLSLGVPVSLVNNVDIKSATDKVNSPMARSELYIVDLLGSDPEKGLGLLAKIFLQMYYSGMRRQSPNISYQQYESAKDKIREIDYRAKHMSLWNELDLPSPYFLGVEKIVDKESGEYAIGILTHFWGGNTHDLDMIAINRRLNKIKEQEERDNIFLTTQIKNKLIEERKDLETKKDEIINSVLRTINDFAVFGTDRLGRDKKMLDDTFFTDSQFYERKGVDYFHRAFKWHCKVRPTPEINQPQLVTDFRGALEPILIRLADKDKFVYAQGDEFLHHYQYNLKIKDGKENLKSGVFDADHSCFNRLERSRLKILLSPSLELDYDDIHRYISKANSDLEEKLNLVVDGSLARQRLTYLTDRENAMVESDLIALYEALCMVGRAAQDDLKNKTHTLLRENLAIPYNNPFIKFKFEENMRAAVSYGAYTPRKIIFMVTEKLNKGINRMLDDNAQHKILSTYETDSLKRLQDILGKFTLPEGTNFRDTSTRY